MTDIKSGSRKELDDITKPTLLGYLKRCTSKDVVNAAGHLFKYPDATSCGLYAASLNSLVPKFFGNDKRASNIWKTVRDFNRLLILLDKHNANDHKYIYAFGTLSRPICLDKHNGERLAPETHLFPGHAFTIIKLKSNRYVFTQSYVNMYDHTQSTYMIDFHNMIKLLIKFGYICDCTVIDKRFVTYWNEITHVDISNLLNARPLIGRSFVMQCRMSRL